ncbi:DUF3846 domain-containing protein [Mycolicibacterium neoaurum]|uniref:DUF3846 domain-containing protein n=1 Tax=Mycolicibacterium neoaurum TaxID=1795 RepID=UPI001F4C9F58|nr:DUF3846 domain-containing protein [Mycolicibacterium neoaurum]
MPTIKGLVVPADSEEPMRVIEMEAGDGNKIREVVGGWFGMSAGVQIPLTFAYHDEGKVINLPKNDRGTAIWWSSDLRFLFFDYLAGDVLILGEPDEEGTTQGIPDDFLEIALKTEACGFSVTAGDRSVESKFRGSYTDALMLCLALVGNNGAVTSFKVFADS